MPKGLDQDTAFRFVCGFLTDEERAAIEIQAEQDPEIAAQLTVVAHLLGPAATDQRDEPSPLPVVPPLAVGSRSRLGLLAGLSTIAAAVFAAVSLWLTIHHAHSDQQLAQALSVLDPSAANEEDLSATQLSAALEVLATSLGRQHPAYRHGLVPLHAALVNSAQYIESQRVALELVELEKSNPSLAGHWLYEAANDADLAGDKETAQRFLVRAAEVGGPYSSSFAWIKLSKREVAQGNFPQAIEFAQRAVEAETEEALRSGFLEYLAGLHAHENQWPDVVASISKAIEIQERNEVAVSSAGLGLLAEAQQRLGNKNGVLTALQIAVEAEERARFGSDALYAQLLVDLASEYFHSGKMELARRRNQRAIEEFERIGSTKTLQYGQSLATAAAIENIQKRPANALRLATQAVQILEGLPNAQGNKSLLAWAWGEVCRSERYMGASERAETAGHRAIQLALEGDDGTLVAYLALQLCAVAVDRGDFANAIERAQAAESADVKAFVLFRHSLHGTALLGLQKWPEAHRELESALAMATQPDERGILQFQMAQALSQIPGQQEEADKLFASSKDIVAQLYPDATSRQASKMFLDATFRLANSSETPAEQEHKIRELIKRLLAV